MPEHPGNLVDNCQPQTQAAILGISVGVDPFELLEHLKQLVAGNTHTGVPDFNTQAMLLATATQQQASGLGIADRIAEKITKDAGQ